MKRNYLNKKSMIKALLSLNQKKITVQQIVSAGKANNLSRTTAINTWNNLVETGRFDLSTKNPLSPSAMQFGHAKRTATKKRTVSSKDAGEIIKKWMKTYGNKTSLDSFCAKEKISVAQYYGWMHELNVSGQLLGRKVLDPKKYGKLDVKIAIWREKVPYTTRKSIRELTDSEALAYDRLTQVLYKYL